MMQSISRSLKPGGRVVLVEYRGEDPAIPIKRLHKLTEAQARKEMAAQPLSWVGNVDVLPRQHILIFEKPRAASADGEPARSSAGAGQNLPP
jgi:hypothetical protein